jgi:hypothetical protein
VCALGGERVPHPAHLQPALVAKWLRGGLRILNLYGITELSVVRSKQLGPCCTHHELVSAVGDVL